MSSLDILRLIAPFSPKELEDIRMHILRDIATKGFSHYLKQIQQITARIPIVLDDDKLMLDDDCWQTPGIWWQEESPWLAELYNKTRLQPGVAKALELLMRETFVEVLIGTPPSMPMQQVLLFRAMLLTYFSNPKELWPIMLNIDSVYQASSNERTAESRTSKSTGRVAEVLKSLSQTPKEGLL